MIGKIILRIRVQLLVLGAFLLLHILSAVGLLPSSSEFSEFLRHQFELYGYTLIAGCSVFENLVVVNVFFPGSIVILTGMALTAGNPDQALLTWFAIVVPSFAGHNVNYIAGRYFGLKKSTHDLRRNRVQGNITLLPLLFLFVSTFWHPHFAALTSTACGAERVVYKRFLIVLLVAGTGWYIFWGVLMYNVGGFLPAGHNMIPLFLCYIVLWVVWDVWQYLKKERRR